MEDLAGWDVLVVQQELHSEDRRKLWAARSGCTRPRSETSFAAEFAAERDLIGSERTTA